MQLHILTLDRLVMSTWFLEIKLKTCASRTQRPLQRGLETAAWRRSRMAVVMGEKEAGVGARLGGYIYHELWQDMFLRPRVMSFSSIFGFVFFLETLRCQICSVSPRLEQKPGACWRGQDKVYCIRNLRHDAPLSLHPMSPYFISTLPLTFIAQWILLT